MVLRYFDLGLAALVCLLAGGLAVHTYTDLQHQQQEPGFLENIAPGTDRFYLLQNDQCVGELSVSFTEAALNELRSKTLLRTFHQGRENTLSIETLAYFNPLGQMVTGDIEAKYDAINLLVRSQNVNPLQVSVRAQLSNHTYEREFTLPGPVSLDRDEESDTYSLRYFYLDRFVPQGISAHDNALKERLGLTTVSADEAPQACREQTALEISELLLEAQEAALKIGAWSPAEFLNLER